MLEIIKSFYLKEAPSYSGVCTFKDVFPASVWLTRTHAINRKTNEKKREKKEKKVTNNVSRLRRRIFEVWQRSMGLALSDCPMHYEVDSSSENFIDNEGAFPFGLELVLFLVRQA